MGRAGRRAGTKVLEQPASEQPGNSFRWLYWRLAEPAFQQLCAALLRDKFDPVRCFPVRMADEGIDAISDRSIIYQVKWSSKLLQNPDRWLEDALREERPKIERLVRQRRITRYILITSVAGTTSSAGEGSIQRLEPRLVELGAQLGVPIEVWWQSDLDAVLDAAPDAIKWSYQEMLAGTEAVRYLLLGSEVEGQAARMRDTVLHVIAAQWREDSKVKFSQADMDRVNLADVFVDVHATLRALPRNIVGRGSAAKDGPGPRGAVDFLQQTDVPLTFLLGVPGQGKSTLGQYLAQLHRAAILPGDLGGDRGFADHSAIDEPLLPIRVDLKDYATWLSGRDPFTEDDATTPSTSASKPLKPPKRRKVGQRSLELFLALLCSSTSGGRSVTVEEVQSLLTRYPTLLILDGLDEVAGPDLRAVVVEQIDLTATWMAKLGRQRRFQILVTARPNASGLAEPDQDMFQTVALEPLTSPLQQQFLGKWCDVNDIDALGRQKVQRVFLDRTAHDHVAQLADNPMQLTILLFLIHRKGDAVPVARTPLYTDYMTALMEREVNRNQIHRDQVPLVEEVTAFLGWHMHAGVDIAPTAGRLPRRKIETTLLIYLRAVESPVKEEQVELLFTATSDRFWALTSKIGDTFEFAVQPVREYFAARFLAQWAGRDLRDPLPKHEVLRMLIDRAYWLNTARFYAGFASPNELAGLRYGLEDAIGSARHPLQTRVATWALLADGVFANQPRVQHDVAGLLADPTSVLLIAHRHHFEPGINFPRLPAVSGGEQLAGRLLDALESDPGSDLALATVDVLRTRTSLRQDAFEGWWQPRALAAAGETTQSAWLRLGARFGVRHLTAEHTAGLVLGEPGHCRAALGAGATPAPRSPTDRTLLRSILDGHCGDVIAPGTGEAAILLRAMRPQWYHQLDEDRRDGPPIGTGHLWIRGSDRAGRADALNQLVTIDAEYERLKRAANPRARGQQGTTEPWQNPARVLCQLHGPSLLAAEIALAGAANPRVRGEGSFDPDGQPFGPRTDYGTLVLDTHRQPGVDWWKSMYDRHRDLLSRQTWCLALLATAPYRVVAEQLAQLNSCLQDLPSDHYAAIAAASSRLGVNRCARQLKTGILKTAAKQAVGNRLLLLLTHFVADLGRLDPLPDLDDAHLAGLASSSITGWPVLRALSARVLAGPTPALLEALARTGCEATVELPQDVPDLGENAAVILSQPSRYPRDWLAAAERQLSDRHAEQPLVAEILARQWVPEVPML